MMLVYAMSAAISAAKAVPEVVATTTGESSMRGIWALVTIAVTVAGTVAVAMIKQWGPWKQADQNAETQLRSEMWRDIQNLKMAKEETSRRLTMAETKISEQASQIGQLRFLVALLNAELERVSPQNAIARQVRVVMEELQTQASSSTAADTGIMAEALAKLCVSDEEEGKPQ